MDPLLVNRNRQPQEGEARLEDSSLWCTQAIERYRSKCVCEIAESNVTPSLQIDDDFGERV